VAAEQDVGSATVGMGIAEMMMSPIRFPSTIDRHLQAMADIIL